ncbi:MAG TPA: tetratricopeptide repeat protein [Planctomycetota bacterium]|nr:tetratricopeptide repeat protein [Planctomycetota bacterium]
MSTRGPHDARQTSRSGRAVAVACALLLALTAASAGETKVAKEEEAFQQLLQRVQADPGGTPEDQVKELITTGQRLGHCYAVSLAVKGYLAQNYRATPSLLLMAAENALLAGDFRTASARYKALLLAAPEGDGAASEAAGRLCQTLVDFLGADDEAYGFLSAHGDQLRQAPAVRQFDAWYLDQARRRRDWAGMARMLQLVLAQGLPLEQERLWFWEHLDFLMGEVVHGREDHFAALPFCRRIVPAVRGDRRRSLQYALFVANLEFKAGSAGKERAALDKAFEPVVAAARACFAACPTAATLKDIVHAFSDGGAAAYFDATAWQRQGALKAAFFVEAFEKLGDADREAILEWRLPGSGPVAGLLASREQWAGLAARHGDLFRRCDATRHIPFHTQAPTRDLIRQQAAVLRAVPSRDAAVINALAAGDGLPEALEHLVRREAWHLDYHEPFDLIEGQLWPAWRDQHAQGGKKPSDADYHRALARFGADVLARTPMALDPRAARACVGAAWDVGDAAAGGDPNSKASLVAVLDSLAWVPYGSRERGDVFSNAHRRFRDWADWVRKDLRAANPKAAQELASQFAPLEQAFRRALDPKADPAKAPNGLCRALAEAIVAESEKSQGDFLKAARTLYPLVRDCDTKRVPFGRAILAYITRCRLDAFETIDFQAEALADQLALRADRLGDAASRRILSEVAEACVFLTPDHGWWQSPLAYRDRTLRLNALFEKALADQLARGQFSPVLFDWFRATRAGDGWLERERGEALMAAIVDRKALHASDYRPDESLRSTTCSYQWLIRKEFPGLIGKYPVERHFDDLFVEEANRTGVFDWRYWDFGFDRQRKVANAAAAFLAKFDALPFGYGDEPRPAWTRADFWHWQTQALGADRAVRDAMLAKAESLWGKTRFDTYAMGGGYFAAAADPSTPDGRREFFRRLRAYLDKVRSAPVRLGPPFLGALAKLGDGKTLTKEELDTLLGIFPQCTPASWLQGWGFETLASLVVQGAVAQGRQADLFRAVPHFWKMARDTRNTAFQHDLAKAAIQFADAEADAGGLSDLALVWSQVGLDLMKTDLPAETASSLVAVRSKSLSNVGGFIPVKRDDRRYPLYAAQAAYLTGKLQSAWELCTGHGAVLKTMLQELDPAFSIWLVGRYCEVGDFGAAEDLARAMIQWFDSVGDGFQPEVRARLLLAYADIACARKEYPRARALYERIAAAKEFEGTRAQNEAQIQVAEVDRQTRRYDQAVLQLEKLTRSKDPYVQAEAYYHIALVKFDQEEHREALENLDAVFARVPDHALARILEGRTKLKMRKLEEPTEIQVGTTAQRRFLVPGKPLKVNLEDRNLAVVGQSAAIEIRAWADSGDEELFLLLPFGDSKTKFRGQLATALAPPAKGNGTLEVVGKDVVRYDFSEGFKRAHKIALSAPTALEVATDAELLVSSGRVLSKDERDARALDALIRQRLGDEEEPEAAVALSTVRAEDQVKPGNRFNVRVVDGDRSATAAKDKVMVRVAAASGDSIAAFPLEETGTHSGVFEGAVPTASGQAVAMASDSDDGREPNSVLSPLAGTAAGNRPAWVGLPDNIRPKSFTIDLNDNVAPGKMRVVANVPGRRLKSFTVGTSLNGRDFQTVGSWPEAFQPWDGSLSLEVVRFGLLNRPPAGLAEWVQYLDEGWLKEGTPKFTAQVRSLEAKWGPGVGGFADPMHLAAEKEGSWFLAHFKGAFYQPMRKVRTFEVATPADAPAGGASCLVAVDGQPAASTGPGPGESATRVRRSLGKGVHRLDVYVAATRKANAEFRVMTDTDAPPFLAPAPFAMFDPAAHPQIKAGVAMSPATVAASEENSVFDVAFPAGLRARVIRLTLIDFETDAPAIARITLDDAAGKAVLPTPEDFMALRQNDVLEIVPGDRITVSYEDPTPITEGGEQHEAFLSATFSNAALSACFVEYTLDGRGERKARYIPMRRFKAGDAIQVFINDPDGDTGDTPDTVAFTVRSTEGKPVELKALETEDHSGVFLGTVFPVKAEPQRPSEIKVAEGDDLLLAYLDKENTDPGIPWERTAVIEQSWFEPPCVRVFEVASAPLPPDELKAAAAAGGGTGILPVGRRVTGRMPVPPGQGAEGITTAPEEVVPATRSMTAAWPQQPEPAKPTPLLLGGPLLVEVLFPFIAQSPESTAALFAQTSSGLKAHGKPPEGPFDPNVPGTIRLVSRPSNAPSPPPPPGYKGLLVRGNPYAGDALDDGRFTFLVPVELGKLPEASLADDDEDFDAQTPPVLSVNGSDEILLGFQFKAPDGKTQWVTRKVSLAADPFFDVMERRCREPLDSVHIGESVYFRVIDPLRDASDQPDAVALAVRATSGATQEVTLSETFTHSGVFKGVAKIAYKGDAAEAKAPGTLAVDYGDKLVATYTRPGAPEAVERVLLVFKGSNAEVVPFTRQFTDPQIAVQTQFSIAEAYFELAKRHRELGQEDLARSEIAQGKKLLEEAIRDFPDTEARAQAEYLLADLALEFASEDKDEDAKKNHYMEAATRFTDIAATYPDSPYAPKAQYKKALVYEKMGLIDQACEEYVKLSYRYPDNELVAETIARLGRYFLTKGDGIRTQAAALPDPVAREKLEMQAREMNKTAAQVFGRLAVRFPTHRLAGRTLVLSAQCYMQAEELSKAVEVFKGVIANAEMEPELIAEAMYWCGDCLTKHNDFVSAFRMFRKLTWDYPASKWSKFARGRLTEQPIANAADKDDK